MLDAREEGKKITARAEDEARQKVVTVEAEAKEKEEKITRAEERIFKREESLDKKQTELEAGVEGVKERIEEVKLIKERAEEMVQRRADELARVAGMTKEEAKNLLMQEMEREQGDDLMMRLAKLEREGHEKLERRAKEILTTAIHRLGNSVASDTMATAITIPGDEKKAVISKPLSAQPALR